VVQQNEIIALLLSLGVLLFVLHNRRRLAHLPAWGVLLAAFYVLLAGRVLTVLEGLFLEEALNLAEHVCYAVSSVLLAVWCWRGLAGKEQAR